MKHTRPQQLYFLEFINHNLDDNKFLKLELRSRKVGADLATKKFIQQAEFPDVTEQEAKELLWTYIRLNGIKTENLYNALQDTNIVIESYKDSQILIERLNDQLKDLDLPTHS